MVGVRTSEVKLRLVCVVRAYFHRKKQLERCVLHPFAFREIVTSFTKTEDKTKLYCINNSALSNIQHLRYVETTKSSRFRNYHKLLPLPLLKLMKKWTLNWTVSNLFCTVIQGRFKVLSATPKSYPVRRKADINLFISGHMKLIVYYVKVRSLLQF